MPKNDLEWLLSQFHQDWTMHFPTWEALVDRWSDDSGPIRTARAAMLVDELLGGGGTEADLSEALDRLGCDYYAAEEPGGYRGWLTAVRERLTSTTMHGA